MPSGAVPEGRGSPLQPKGAGLSGITRKRVGFPLKILELALSSSSSIQKVITKNRLPPASILPAANAWI